MKKIFLFLLLVISFTVVAQKTYTIEKPLQLNTVNEGVKSDSVLVRGTDKIVKYVPRSEFGGGSQTLQQAMDKGRTWIDDISNPNLSLFSINDSDLLGKYSWGIYSGAQQFANTPQGWGLNSGLGTSNSISFRAKVSTVSDRKIGFYLDNTKPTGEYVLATTADIPTDIVTGTGINSRVSKWFNGKIVTGTIIDSGQAVGIPSNIPFFLGDNGGVNSYMRFVSGPDTNWIQSGFGVDVGTRRDLAITGMLTGNEWIRFKASGSILINTKTDNLVDKLQVNGTVSGSPATLSNQYVTKAQLDATAISGSYTATISNPVNTTAGALGTVYSKIGDIVTVRLYLSSSATVAGQVSFDVSLPFNRARSNNLYMGSGVFGYGNGSYSPCVIQSSTTDSVKVIYTAESVATSNMGVILMYSVLN